MEPIDAEFTVISAPVPLKRVGRRLYIRGGDWDDPEVWLRGIPSALLTIAIIFGLIFAAGEAAELYARATTQGAVLVVRRAAPPVHPASQESDAPAAQAIDRTADRPGSVVGS